MRNKYLILLVLSLAFIATRMPLITGSLDELYIEDELYRGNIGREIIAGRILPLLDYQRSEYEGGSLVVGILSVPFFRLFGESLFSLKLVALFLSLLALVAFYLFLERFFSLPAAILTGIFWILSPPLWTRGGLYAMGAPIEIAIFNILALYIFYRIFYERKATRPAFALLGFTCGFSFFFAYYFAAMLLVILLLWFVFDKKLYRRLSFAVFVVFFLTGFAPWIIYNLRHTLSGLTLADQPVWYWFTRIDFLGSLSRFKDLLTWQLPDSFDFPAPLGRMAALLYYLALVLPVCWLLFHNRRQFSGMVSGVFSAGRKVEPEDVPRESALVVFILIFCLIYSFSKFEFRSHYYAGQINRYRYIVPVYPFLFSLASIAICRLASLRRPLSGLLVPGIFAATALALAAFADLTRFSFAVPRPFMYTIYRGYNYYDLGKLICWRYRDPAVMAGAVNRVKRSDDRRLCYAGMGWGFAKERFGADQAFYLRNVLKCIDRKLQPYAWERLGFVIGYRRELAKEAMDHASFVYYCRGAGEQSVESGAILGDPQGYLRIKQTIDEEALPYFHEGAGTWLFGCLVQAPDKFLRLAASLDEPSRKRLYEGLAQGREYVQYSYDRFSAGINGIGFDARAWKTIAGRIEPQYLPYCYQGLGVEIGWRLIHGINKYRQFLAQVDETCLASLYKGIGIGIGWRFGYDLAGCMQLAGELDAKYLEYVYEGLGSGVMKRNPEWAFENGRDASKVPAAYRAAFEEGLREARGWMGQKI